MKFSRKNYSTNTLTLQNMLSIPVNSPKPFHKPCLKLQAVNPLSPKSSLPSLPKPSHSTDFLSPKHTSKAIAIKSPVSPKNSLQHLSPYSSKHNSSILKTNLNEFEKEEIKDFKKVYFLSNLKQKLNPNASNRNNGFDFENGNYKLICGDHLAYRYEIRNIIGKGSFGVVCECFDHKTKEPVAIKILKNKSYFFQQGTVEVSILKSIKDNDPVDQNNLIKLKLYFIFRNHICLVFPLLGRSLYDYISSSKVEGLSIKQVKEFTKQVLAGLISLNAMSIIHCDLKPENLLFTVNSLKTLKIIDFGSSCFFHDKVHSYIQSRFYRAPEIVFGIPYCSSIDIWSLGCLICEMVTGEVLFPAETEENLVALMVELIGMPPSCILEKAVKNLQILDLDRIMLSDGKEIKARSKKIVTSDSLMLDLIFKCLEWDPEKRIKAQDAILHPWLTTRKKKKSISHRKFLQRGSTKHKAQ